MNRPLPSRRQVQAEGARVDRSSTCWRKLGRSRLSGAVRTEADAGRLRCGAQRAAKLSTTPAYPESRNQLEAEGSRADRLAPRRCDLGRRDRDSGGDPGHRGWAG